MKEAFVFPAPCKLLNRPRRHSAHANINDNILCLFCQDGETPGGLAGKLLVKITKSHQFHLAMPSSSVLDFKAKDTMLKLLESGHVEGKKS